MSDIVTNIDFSDASFKFCEISEASPSGRTLTAYLTSWDDKIIKIEFHNTLQFSYKIGSVIKNLQVKDKPVLLNEALLLHYEIVPTNHNFKEFALIDIEDFPFFEVVAKDVQVTKSS